MKGRNWLRMIVLCALLLPGLAPAREPVQAELAQQAAPENLGPLRLDSHDMSEVSGWDEAKYYATIQSGDIDDIDGDGVDELLARRDIGMDVWRYNAAVRIWELVACGGPFQDDAGWHDPDHYATIHSADIDGDEVDELLGRGYYGMVAYRLNGASWELVAGGGPFPDEEGWDEAKHYATIHSADIDGDGVDELLGRGTGGMEAWRFDVGSKIWTPVAGGGPVADGTSWDDDPKH